MPEPLSEKTREGIAPSNTQLVLCIDKMSRLFYCTENRTLTFQFPFIVYSKTTNKFCSIFCPQCDLMIDNLVTSLLLALFRKEGLFNLTLSQMEEIIIEEILLNGWEDDLDENKCLHLVRYLMLFEPGYLRYEHDDDESRVNKLYHPEYHIDWFYSDNNTVKLGLKDAIDCEGLIDILDRHTRCRYIGDC